MLRFLVSRLLPPQKFLPFFFFVGPGGKARLWQQQNFQVTSRNLSLCLPKYRKNELSSDEEMAESPKKVAALTNETKRKSEDGDSPLKSRKSSKKMKIESSSEEEEESPKAESPKKKEKSPKTQKKADKTEKTLKASKKEEKPEKTPKSSKKTEKPEKKEKTPKGSKKASAENKSPKKPSPIKEEENASPKKEEKASPKKEETSLKKSPVATQKMLSIVADADLGNYDPSKKKYHPINDAFWKGT